MSREISKKNSSLSFAEEDCQLIRDIAERHGLQVKVFMAYLTAEPGGSPEPAISEHVKPTGYAIPPRPHPNPFGCKVVNAG